MRYRKGSVALSTTRDYPLLRQVLHSGFITHRQLFEFLKLDYCASSRNAFNNRVLRLCRHGLLTRHDLHFANHESIYSVTPVGASELVGRGEYCVPSAGILHSRSVHSSIHHSLELNEIHLALKRTGALVYWMQEIEIRSRNDFTSSGYWKYYDAVVVVRLAGQDCKFALEYERTAKAARYYIDVRERIEQEAAVAHFLYLVSNPDLLRYVSEKLSYCKRSIYFGLARDFLHQTLALPVRRSTAPASASLISLLGQGKALQSTPSLFPGIAV
jgi:hypothetical protein